MERIDRQESVDTVFDGITYQMLLCNEIRGILKLEIDEAAGEVSYDTEGYTPVKQLYAREMPRKAAVQILKGLLDVWVAMDEYMIPRNELLMTLSDLYSHDGTGEIRWICGLQKDARSPVEKMRLLMAEIVTVMEGIPEQNQENMITLLNYVKNVKSENLDQCKAMVDALLIQDIVADSAEAAAAEGFEGYEPVRKEEGAIPGSGQQEKELDIMLPDAFSALKEVAYIIRIRTGDEMAIVLDETLIGKSPDADFCIPDNRAVSRHHASILMDGGEYYLVDHNSTNSTYLNGMRLDPGDEYRLCHGDGFVLADEPFQFMIR